VVFAVTQGGGTLTGATDTTDANGLASVGSWTLGPTVGLNALTATVSGITPVQFLALGTSTGGVTSMTLNAGDGQTALGGSAVAIPPSVLLTDTAGAPIAGVEVTFAIMAGFGGSLADTTPVSDASGIASVGTWTLGLPGTNSLTASLPGLPDVTFSATATVGQPAQILIVSGNNQSDTAGTALAAPLVIEVRDSASNPVPSVGVTWNTLDGTRIPASCCRCRVLIACALGRARRSTSRSPLRHQWVAYSSASPPTTRRCWIWIRAPMAVSRSPRLERPVRS
jgi:adhesin/invasin